MHMCPGFWRLWLCVNIVYVPILIFALFQVSSVDLRQVVEAGGLRTVLLVILFLLCSQTADDTRQFLRLYDPDLGQSLPERTYAEDCRIYTPGHPNGSFANIMDKMDVFVPCHFIGWFVKVSSSSLSSLPLSFPFVPLPVSLLLLPISSLFPHFSPPSLMTSSLTEDGRWLLSPPSLPAGSNPSWCVSS